MESTTGSPLSTKDAMEVIIAWLSHDVIVCYIANCGWSIFLYCIGEERERGGGGEREGRVG